MVVVVFEVVEEAEEVSSQEVWAERVFSMNG